MNTAPAPWADRRITANDLARLIHVVNGAEGEPKLPTKEQERIIEAPPEPLLVVAGAGAGKTETMSHRVLWLVANQGFAPEEILGLTFTRKAAHELGARLAERLGAISERFTDLKERALPVSLTYNSFASRLVAEHGLRIGIDPDARLLGQSHAVQMVEDIVTRWTGTLSGDKSVGAVVVQVIGLSEQIANHDLTLDGARREFEELRLLLHEHADPKKGPGRELAKIIATNDLRIQLLDVVAEYERRKREEGLLDFGDQVRLAARIARTCPDVVEQVRLEHRAVLLDEFQDTSVVQMNLLSALFKDHPVTAVGDPNQAIYGWRGASAGSLETFLARFQSTPARADQTLTLSTAWRNDRRILTVANRIAAPLRAAASRAASPQLRPRAGAGAGEVLLTYGVRKEDAITGIVDFIAAERRTPVTAGKPVTTAVLCRRRRDFTDIVAAFHARGIPVQVVGLGGLLAQAPVQDVRAALRLAVDVRHTPSLLRLLDSVSIGGADLVAMHRHGLETARMRSGDVAGHPDVALVEVIDDLPAGVVSQWAKERVDVLAQRLRAIRAGVGQGVGVQVERAIGILGLVEDIISDPEENHGREALDAFVEVAHRYATEVPRATLAGFLSWLDVAETEERGLEAPVAPPDPAAVQVMTIHAAKGLEWDAVAVFPLNDGILPDHATSARARTVVHLPGAAGGGWWSKVEELPPHVRGDADQLPRLDVDPDAGRTPQSAFNNWFKKTHRAEWAVHHELEERRLAYVGITRARRAALLAGYAWDAGVTTARRPSVFFEEARLHLVELAARASSGDGRAKEELALTEAAEAQALLDALEEVPDPGTEFPEVDPREWRGRASTWPRLDSRTRRLLTKAASEVESISRVRLAEDIDVLAALEDLAEHPLVAEAAALVQETRERRARGVIDVSLDALPATSMSALVEDPAAYAMRLRRPMPEEPTRSAAFGTVLHARIEEMLRTAALPEEDEGTARSLDPELAARADRLMENLARLDLPGEAVALEHPFSVDVAGVPVRGRIDAVFRGEGGDTVVDWKTGRVPDQSTEPATLRYFAMQLRLYRRAWAEHVGRTEDEVGAQVVFLAGPRVFTLVELEHMLGEETALDDLMRGALGGRTQ